LVSDARVQSASAEQEELREIITMPTK